jgi:tetratricopeptide (TPR) repeat protein
LTSVAIWVRWSTTEAARRSEERALRLGEQEYHLSQSSELQRLAGTREIRERASQRNVERLQELVDKPGFGDFASHLVDGLLDLGDLAIESGDTSSAEKRFLLAKTRCASISDSLLRAGLLESLACKVDLRLADLHRGQGDLATARREYESAMASARAAVSMTDALPAARYLLAMACERFGNSLALTGERELSAAMIEEASSTLQALQASDPANRAWSQAWVDLQGKRARALQLGGDMAGALALCEDVLRANERSAREAPNDIERCQQHARALRSLGDCLQASGRAAEALPYVQRARDARRAILDVEPLHAAAWLDLVRDLFWCAQTAEALGQLASAEQAAREALERVDKLIGRDPRNLDAARLLPQVLSALGSVVWKANGPSAAEEHLARAAEVSAKIQDLAPASAIDAKTTAESWQALAGLREVLGNRESAERARVRARQAFQRGIDSFAGAAQADFRIGLLAVDLQAAVAAGDVDAIDRISLELLPLQRQAHEHAPSPNAVTQLFVTLHYRSNACLKLEKYDEAFVAFDEIRARSAPYRNGGIALPLRRLFADARFAHQAALHEDGRQAQADEVAREALDWYQALQRDGNDAAERISDLQRMLAR